MTTARPFRPSTDAVRFLAMAKENGISTTAADAALAAGDRIRFSAAMSNLAALVDRARAAKVLAAMNAAAGA